jgi:hypothetical protein
MFKALFYQYYLFYLKIYKEEEPIFTATLSLIASEIFISIGIFSTISAALFSFRLTKLFMLIIAAVVTIYNLFFYLKETKAKEIIETKPLILNNRKLSIFIGCFFFMISVLTMFFLNAIIDLILKY